MARLRCRNAREFLRLGSRGRCVILAASVVSALVLAGVAAATTFYYVGNLGVGGYASSTGWNNRDYNRACRDDGFYGDMAVGYYNTSMGLDFYSGVVTTKCSNDLYIARLENDGYFKTRCWNDGGTQFWVVCQTTP
jgi:hypothetical protein